ncbi:MAG: hypothetical protein ACK5LO_03185, partial [Leucobacter sp.]
MSERTLEMAWPTTTSAISTKRALSQTAMRALGTGFCAGVCAAVCAAAPAGAGVDVARVAAGVAGSDVCAGVCAGFSAVTLESLPRLLLQRHASGVDSSNGVRNSRFP